MGCRSHNEDLRRSLTVGVITVVGAQQGEAYSALTIRPSGRSNGYSALRNSLCWLLSLLTKPLSDSTTVVPIVDD